MILILFTLNCSPEEGQTQDYCKLAQLHWKHSVTPAEGLAQQLQLKECIFASLKAETVPVNLVKQGLRRGQKDIFIFFFPFLVTF